MVQDGQTGGAQASRREQAQKFYLAAWRWHFYAGLFVVPFLIILPLTGLIMMFITQADGRDGEKITLEIKGQAMPASELADMVQARVPGRVVEWIGPKAPDLATVFRVKAETGQRMVAIDQYSREVIQVWDRRAGWYDPAGNIHSTLLMGDTGDRILEIAAGMALLLAFTGLYRWWPRGNVVAALVPDLRARGRAFGKSLHAVAGF